MHMGVEQPGPGAMKRLICRKRVPVPNYHFQHTIIEEELRHQSKRAAVAAVTAGRLGDVEQRPATERPGHAADTAAVCALQPGPVTAVVAANTAAATIIATSTAIAVTRANPATAIVSRAGLFAAAAA